MTGPEHYRAAEELLAEAGELGRTHPQVQTLIATAQVHALLASTAATALPLLLTEDGLIVSPTTQDALDEETLALLTNVDADQGPTVPSPMEEWSDVIF